MSKEPEKSSVELLVDWLFLAILVFHLPYALVVGEFLLYDKSYIAEIMEKTGTVIYVLIVDSYTLRFFDKH